MKAYFNKIIFMTYDILANKYFGFIFGINLWTNLHNILDLDSCNPCLSILSSRFVKYTKSPNCAVILRGRSKSF
jgi:hypothetical protein